jgi:hypothetical protein
VLVGVIVAVFVRVAVRVVVGELVGVYVRVAVGVLVDVFAGVFVRVAVGVAVGGTAVLVCVGVTVGVLVDVAVGVLLGVEVGVLDAFSGAATDKTTWPAGALALSAKPAWGKIRSPATRTRIAETTANWLARFCGMTDLRPRL